MLIKKTRNKHLTKTNLQKLGPKFQYKVYTFLVVINSPVNSHPSFGWTEEHGWI